MAIYTAPDGKKFNIPTDPSELAAFEGAVKSVYGGDIYETTVLGQARETLKGIPRGAIGMAVDIPLGAASLFDIGNDSDFVSGLQQYKDFLNTESSLAADPAYRDTWMTKLGEGAGSFVPFLGAGKIGQLMKARGIGGAGIRNPMLTVPAAIAIPSGIAQQADRVSAARELGEDVGGVLVTLIKTPYSTATSEERLSQRLKQEQRKVFRKLQQVLHKTLLLAAYIAMSCL